MNNQFDVCIRGAGIVGRALALALAKEKLHVALVDDRLGKPAPAADIRAYALNAGSVQLLQSLRCWPHEHAATAITTMQVFGDGNGMVQFQSQDIHHAALAHIVDTPALEQALQQAVQYQPFVEVVAQPVSAALTAICEGKFSNTRKELGVDYESTAYPQHALATRVRSTQPHHGRARQWFQGDSILALLPLGGADGDEYAIVWSTAPEQARHLQALDEGSFIAQLMALTQANATLHETDNADDGSSSVQESFSLIAPRLTWPLHLCTARQWSGPMQSGQPAAGSWVLLGDAAHTVHPLAGSGLNLGLGDVKELACGIAQRQAWRSVGDMKLLRSYERARKSAIWPFVAATDGLQQLFFRNDSTVHMLRNWGMRNFERCTPIKQWVTRLAAHS